ncbi:hypothetical protein KHA93_11625 [Bacillus sp. FJAT-49732]|uniref:Uncharacterized protein n=1 Tax=Lederbergia citrisecunda TaxID=2833583 RepID=A0A942TLE3_9BACI|nr:hypothetical protein [Lederbergia citrisecunda]MBS4200280.1 hypothetical protein [Lederbergia citrisecunda]
MNLGEAKKKTLSLIDEFSVDGVSIPDGENADYLNRMNRFASDAQMEISDRIGIESSYIFEQNPTNEEGYFKYDLPDDFKDHRYINLNDERFSAYRIENRKLFLRKGIAGEFEHFYFKYPQELSKSTEDTYEFEVELHAQQLIPYFIGGMLMQDENSMMSDRLLNLYYSKLANISKRNDDYPNYIQADYRF